MNIYHWVPSSGAYPAWPCVESWINLLIPEGSKRIFSRSMPGNVKAIWNEEVRKFLKSDCEWLFSTHLDVAFSPPTLLRLLSWNKPLVSALVFMRHSPIVPHIWKAYEGHMDYYALRVNDTRSWFYDHRDYIKFGPFVMDERPEDALAEVNFTSTACTLIHRSTLEIMNEFVRGEWFVCDDEINGGGEDRRFHQYAKLAGITGYVDRSCVAGHLVGDIPTGVADFIAWDSIAEFNATGEPVTKSLEPGYGMEDK